MKFTVAFYNLENLFDYRNNINTLDDDFLPNSGKRWTKKRYYKKIERLGHVISLIGVAKINKPPSIVGLAEIENKKVLHDLVNSKHLKKINYRYIHYDSLDERGVDVALLYDPLVFTMVNSKPHKIELKKQNGELDHTRDVLSVEGIFMSEPVCFIVNHWPSRREGIPISEPKRRIAAKLVGKITREIKEQQAKVKIIVMGDFNDNPTNKSLEHLNEEHGFFNTMSTMLSYTRGSVNFRGQWNLFDQILLSPNFFNTSNNKLQFDSANIFDASFLKQQKGKYKGQPKRSYIGDKFKSGYSDHFPVYISLTV